MNRNNPNSQIVVRPAEELPQDEEHNQNLIKKWLKKNKPSVKFKDEKLTWKSEQKALIKTPQTIGGGFYRG